MLPNHVAQDVAMRVGLPDIAPGLQEVCFPGLDLQFVISRRFREANRFGV